MNREELEERLNLRVGATIFPAQDQAIERVLNPRTRSQGAEFFRVISGAESCTATACSVPGIEVLDGLPCRGWCLNPCGG